LPQWACLGGGEPFPLSGSIVGRRWRRWYNQVTRRPPMLPGSGLAGLLGLAGARHRFWTWLVAGGALCDL